MILTWKITISETLIFTLLCALILPSCQGTYWDRTPVVKDRDVKTYLEQNVEDEVAVDQCYEHPYSFDDAELELMLKGLCYEEPKFLSDPVVTPVFQPQEATRLAAAISPALGVASSSQRIRFVSFNTSGWGIITSKRKTEGVCFMEPGKKLNIAFIVINDPQDPREAGSTDPYVSYVNPFKITSASNPLVPTEWYTIHQDEKDSSRENVLWAVIDLEKSRQWFREQGTDVVLIPQPAVPEGEATKAIKIPPETEAALDEELAKDPAPIAPAKESKASEAPDTLKQDLQRLKQFFDEGLITEEEYKTKKSELLKKM